MLLHSRERGCIMYVIIIEWYHVICRKGLKEEMPKSRTSGYSSGGQQNVNFTLHISNIGHIWYSVKNSNASEMYQNTFCDLNTNEVKLDHSW